MGQGGIVRGGKGQYAGPKKPCEWDKGSSQVCVLARQQKRGALWSRKSPMQGMPVKKSDPKTRWEEKEVIEGADALRRGEQKLWGFANSEAGSGSSPPWG